MRNENKIEEKGPITDSLLKKMDAYWRAANYLSAAQLYLLDNPLLKRPLKNEDIKKKIVGHWGTVPGQNFIYVYCNRVIKRYDLDMILLSGSGHGGNFLIANDYLEGTYSEVYPNISEDEAGLKNSSSSSLSLAECLPIARQKPQARSMRAGSSAIASPTLSERYSITRI